MASFKTFVPKVSTFEGGYTANPSDTGNYNSKGELVGTNRGIAAKTYEAEKKVVPTVAIMKSITKDEAHNIFKLKFWDKMQGDKITTQTVAEQFVDMAINAGNSKAISIMVKLLQDEFKKSIGSTNNVHPTLINAINSINGIALTRAYAAARENYYRGTGNKTFLKGWLRRVVKLTKDQGFHCYNDDIESGLFYIGQNVVAKYNGVPVRKYSKVSNILRYNISLPILLTANKGQYIGRIVEIQRYKDFDVLGVKLQNGQYAAITSNATKKQ